MQISWALTEFGLQNHCLEQQFLAKGWYTPHQCWWGCLPVTAQKNVSDLKLTLKKKIP